MARIKVHGQVRPLIERLIGDQGIKPGPQIPTETELAGEFNVSRTTIRNALHVLEQEGKIERTRGRGTIVKLPRLGQLLGKLLSFSEEMKLRGLTPSNRLIEITQTVPSTPIRTLLRLAGESVWRIQRIRWGNAEPIAMETCHLPWSALSEQDAAS